MLPYSLKNYGESMVATVLSANNLLLYFTSGYWSLAANFKPLFHTWSLGVEEQFYFLAPITLLLLSTCSRRSAPAMALGLAAILGASFYWGLSSKDGEFVFLSLLTRAWELLAGGLLALAPPPSSSSAKTWSTAGP